jgi:polyisoprenyl-phosphate glycosyltransferase
MPGTDPNPNSASLASGREATQDGPSGKASVPLLSVVVPVYGCRSCLGHLYGRLTAALKGNGTSYEILLVDDRGTDGSWEEIERLVALDDSVGGILLSRNFGQHAAITAGLQFAQGDWVAVIDCDLQDPPEEIPRLYAKALQGYDIVFGRRVHKRTTWPRKRLASMYYRILRMFAGVTLTGDYGDLSVLSRKAVDAFLQLREQDRQYVMILTWLGFDTAVVDYEPAPRYRGRSSYSLSRLFALALSGIFFQTTFLLRWIAYLGLLLAWLGTLLALYLLGARLVGNIYPGWTGIIVSILLLSGFIILSTGVTGLYIGKVFDQSRGRPLFIVDRMVESPRTPASEHPGRTLKDVVA